MDGEALFSHHAIIHTHWALVIFDSSLLCLFSVYALLSVQAAAAAGGPGPAPQTLQDRVRSKLV